jgi:hypothetical protein
LPVPGVLAVKAVVFCVTAIAVYTAGLHAVAIIVGVIAFLNAGVAVADRDALGGGAARWQPLTSSGCRR